MSTDRLSALIERLARLSASEAWETELNPTQFAALDYLARANRFSRSPSHVADYLGATRGTVSQTLKSLARKGLIAESRAAADRRAIHYTPTPEGRALLAGPRLLDRLGGDSRDLEDALSRLLADLLAERGGRPFGLCRGCRHHARRDGAGYCALLDTPLAPGEEDLVCHEFAA